MSELAVLPGAVLVLERSRGSRGDCVIRQSSTRPEASSQLARGSPEKIPSAITTGKKLELFSIPMRAPPARRHRRPTPSPPDRSDARPLPPPCGRARASVGIGYPPSWSGSGVPVGLRPDSSMELRPGMVFHLMSWLLRTPHGDSFLSDTIVVTENGCEFLTGVARELTVR
ncbi:MAG: hypothetical protein ACREQY_02640 [Candidatus Binatia bacterium]